MTQQQQGRAAAAQGLSVKIDPDSTWALDWGTAEIFARSRVQGDDSAAPARWLSAASEATPGSERPGQPSSAQ